ncbi:MULTISPECIES: hypothetical protein [Idiomarina]|uniref:hypothetical protein n=1 Tax=Idiomarina TaxID=135575 RepID=UPI00129C720C|nr:MULTISPECIES: hypothetical protein [Idiomarina]MRJ42883.1 hypothetical protein [Idiomarina sp. FeN1]NCU58434.1 hypothetical protein [Idiomarina sp. FenA--70]NCU61131.1 hypothetical protein [Idiomarina sp. FenBw--71]UUN13633.1 hypothetical protein KGF88_13635 [Idiomarina loihiensis]
MKLRLIIIAVITGTILSGAFLAPAWQTTASNYTQQCEQLLDVSEQHSSLEACVAPAKQVSWHAWFTGQSRSTQFHFLDLFELLFNSKDKSKRHYENPLQ